MDEPENTAEDNPFGRVVSRWEQVVEDMAVTAEDYEAAGWTTVELHPGDVAVPGEEADDEGLDVLVPNDEFDHLREVVADRVFDSYEVLRGTDEGIVFVLVVLEDSEGEVAVFVPAYYEESDLDALREAAADGTLTTTVRALSEEEAVEFEHDEPDPFFPDEE